MSEGGSGFRWSYVLFINTLPPPPADTRSTHSVPVKQLQHKVFKLAGEGAQLHLRLWQVKVGHSRTGMRRITPEGIN